MIILQHAGRSRFSSADLCAWCNVDEADHDGDDLQRHAHLLAENASEPAAPQQTDEDQP